MNLLTVAITKNMKKDSTNTREEGYIHTKVQNKLCFSSSAKIHLTLYRHYTTMIVILYFDKFEVNKFERRLKNLNVIP